MHKFRKVCSITGFHFKKWMGNRRVYVIFVFVTLYQLTQAVPIQKFCNDYGLRVNGFIFPFLYNGNYSIMMIMLGLVLLFCDAPFVEEAQPYMLMRSGRRLWTIGQMLYILCASAVYFLTLFFIHIISLIPNVTFMGGWGKVVSTLVETWLSREYKISAAFSKDILVNFTPIQATLISLGLFILVGTFLGMLMYTVNLYAHQIVGAVLASGLVLIQFLTLKISGRWFVYFSPVSWCSMDTLNFSKTSEYPSPQYAVLVLLTGIFICVVCSLHKMKRNDIVVLESI